MPHCARRSSANVVWSVMQQELSRYLFLAGGLILALLGVAHATLTPRYIGHVTGLSPSDPQLATAMSRTHIRLTRRVDMWAAWVGFNYSHSLGLIVLGGLVLLIGRNASSFIGEATVFVPFAFAASAIYLLLGVRYWFRTPIIGAALCCVLFFSSWLLQD